MNIDVIDQLLSMTSDSELGKIRHARDKVVSATQASFDGYFADHLSQLSLTQRLEIAQLCAEAAPCPLLSRYYAQRVSTLQASTPENSALGVNQAQMQAARKFAKTLSTKPIEGDQALLLSLREAGLETPTIIALAQLVAFVSYQTRSVQGLRALNEALPEYASHFKANSITSTAAASPTVSPALGSSIRIKGFTNESLEWKSWLDTVNPQTASAEQLAVLKESHPKAMTSDYYLVLVHQAELLKQRSIAFNAIMYAPGGLSRAERELASAVVSRINGCVYCASVHAQRFEQLAKRNDAIVQVFEDPNCITTSARDKAIADVSIALTLHPDRVGAADIFALAAQGISANEALDLIYSIAIFAWANRLMLNLGEPVTVAA